MRISDWTSDVCSSDLLGRRTAAPTGTSHPPDIERTGRSALNVRRSARISMIPKAVMQGWRRLSVHRLLRLRLPAPQAEDHALPCDGQRADDAHAHAAEIARAS